MSTPSREAFERAFAARLQQLIAQGMSPNEAATQALLQTRSAAMKGSSGETNSAASGPPASSSSAPAAMDIAQPQTQKDAQEEAKAPEMAPEITSPSSKRSSDKPVEVIDMDVVRDLYSSCLESGSFGKLTDFVYRVVSRPRSVAQSFAPKEVSMALETGESSSEERKVPEFEVDIAGLDEFVTLLSDSDVESVRNVLRNAMSNLVQNLKSSSAARHVSFLRCIVLIFEYFSRSMDPSADDLMRYTCGVLDDLRPEFKEAFTEWFKGVDTERYKRYLVLLRQHTTFLFYQQHGVRFARIAVRCLAILHGALQSHPEVDFKEFYNDALNEEYFTITDARIEEFKKWSEDQSERRHDRKMQSFISYPFVLTPANKQTVMEIDAQLQMRREMNHQYMSAILGGGGYMMPYFVMRVRRDHIIQDTLGQISVSDDSEFKKPLKIIFDGEEGVDAGGLQKEYYQVMTRQLLDPNFGMFSVIEDSNTLWFNSSSLESDMEFELVGTLLGIAIYNSIILDLHFPMVVYRKLKNKQLTLDDLATLQPATAKGLRQLLEFDGDVEQAFGFTFQLSHEVFGEVQTVDLVENGGEKPVTNENREEYVSLYVDWILNKSVESQFRAFARGFRKVCSGPAFDLFIAEELELLLCGNPLLDFDALQRGTRYEDGYDANSPLIHDFWAVLHDFNDEEKRAFLKFISGSDRAPIDGLSQLGFVISKNGGDSDRLPSAHTCFNHLLLPQYTTRAKLAEKLRLAINNAEGFGLR